MSEHAGLTPPSREDAERWLGEVGMFSRLEVAEVTPAGEVNPRWLSSLLDMVEFIVPSEDLGQDGQRPAVNYADPALLVAWVRNTIADTELADRMDEVIASRKGYAVLAPEIRQLALDRVIQCWEILKP